MTNTIATPRDRASDFSDAVVASYIRDISARRRQQRAEPRDRAEAFSSTRTRGDFYTRAKRVACHE